MIALLLLLSALLAGGAWARLLPGRLGWPERVAAAGVASTLGGMWVAWLAVLACGFSVGAVAAVAALLVAAVVGWRRARRGAPPTAATPRGLRWWWLGTTTPLSALLAYLDSTHFLPRLDGGWGSAGSTWGDLALHASLTARFAQQAHFEWDFPLLFGAPLTYPFLPDFWSGLLHRGGFPGLPGLPMRWALLLPTLVLGLSLVQLLFFAAWRATRSRLGAAIASLLVIFDGSAAGLPVLWREWRDGGLPFFDYLRAVRHDFAHVPAINLRFSNIVCDALLPQRGMLVGLGAFLLAALLLRGAWEREAGSGRGARGALAAAALVLGALPFVHVHTFLVLAGVMAWLATARFVHRRPGAWRWAGALGGGIVLALPQLAWQLAHAYGESFSHWQLGWMTAPGEDPLSFWARNLGVLLPILAAAPWWLRRWPAGGFWLHLLAPCLALFFVANLYLFQPHAYDNLKLLFYAYLALAVGAARLLSVWWRRGWPGKAIAAAIVLLATASGGFSVLREATLHWPLLDAGEVAIGMDLRRLTPTGARFLTADQHDHPVPVVAGRPIVLGYRGWLWTYGLHVAPVLADVRAIYAGDDRAPELLQRYGVGYVFVGPGERRAFVVDDAFFAGSYPLLLKRGPFLVYRIGYGTGSAGSGSGLGAGTKVPAPAGSLPEKRAASK